METSMMKHCRTCLNLTRMMLRLTLYTPVGWQKCNEIKYTNKWGKK